MWSFVIIEFEIFFDSQLELLRELKAVAMEGYSTRQQHSFDEAERSYFIVRYISESLKSDYKIQPGKYTPAASDFRIQRAQLAPAPIISGGIDAICGVPFDPLNFSIDAAQDPARPPI